MTAAHGPMRIVPGDRLSIAQLYALLKLRVEVFVVEQGDPYQALDGYDLSPTTRFMWVERDFVIASAIRVVEWQGQWRIGAVITRPHFRGQGLAGLLIRQALARTLAEDPRRDVVVHAQAHLADWYSSFGFVVEGAEHVEGTVRHRWLRLTR